MPTFQHAIGQGRASCEGGSPLFRSKTKAMAEMMCAWRTRGRSLQKNRSNCRPVRCCRGDGTVRARERGDLWAPSAPPAYLAQCCSAYTKVYESVCPVGVGVHCGTMGPGLRQPRRWNPGLEPKLLGHLT